MRRGKSKLVAGMTVLLLAWGAAQTQAVPTITLQSDWADMYVESTLEGYPGSPWSESYHGPIGTQYAISCEKTFGEPECHGYLSAYSAAYGPPGDGEYQMVVRVISEDAVDSWTGKYDALAQSETTWHFRVGLGDANFFARVMMESGGGYSRFSLYDETAETTVASLDRSASLGTQATSGVLLANHEYRMTTQTLVVTYDGPNWFGFNTDAQFVPEPCTGTLLILGLLRMLRRRR